MSGRRMNLVGLIGALALAGGTATAAEQWRVVGGDTTVALNATALEAAGVSVDVLSPRGVELTGDLLDLSVSGSTASLVVQRGLIEGAAGQVGHDITLRFVAGDTEVELAGMAMGLGVDSGALVSFTPAVGNGTPMLQTADAKMGFDGPGGTLLIEGAELRITGALADALGRPELAGVSIGAVFAHTTVARVGWSTTDVSSDEEGGVAGGNNGTICPTPVGPDVIVGDLSDVANYESSGGIEAFAVGTVSCNVGDANLLWIAGNNQHPVIGQSMYRLKNGRFEHIGQSWLKHGFTALTMNLCGCGCSGQGGAVLGVGCSDPYGGGLNGSQSGLGPKSQVNPHTGFFTYPHDSSSGNSIYKRVQVRISDLDPNQNGGGQYFVEGQYVAPDDAFNGNQDNNTSYRAVTVSGSGNNWNANVTGQTQREQPAIRAWKDTDPSVTETDVRVPDEGLFILAAKATENGDGTWHYEYALQNLNSDKAAGAFTVPVVQSAIVQNIGFHDVDYHSGEPYSLADWTADFINGELRWSTEAYESNPNANALRWGTLYNFRFDCNLAPATGDVSISLFKPGSAPLPATTVIPDPTGGDCNFNALPDYCDVSCSGGTGGECNLPGCGMSVDCNGNGAPDECEVNRDCNHNQVPDDCDLASGTSPDCDTNSRPDECDPDFDGDESIDGCDEDIDGDGVGNNTDVCDYTTIGAPIRTNGAQMGDFNSDCDIDLPDYFRLNLCFPAGGPGGTHPSSGCRSIYDANGDLRIDLLDIAYFDNSFSGSQE